MLCLTDFYHIVKLCKFFYLFKNIHFEIVYLSAYTGVRSCYVRQRRLKRTYIAVKVGNNCRVDYYQCKQRNDNAYHDRDYYLFLFAQSCALFRADVIYFALFNRVPYSRRLILWA